MEHASEVSWKTSLCVWWISMKKFVPQLLANEQQQEQILVLPVVVEMLNPLDEFGGVVL
jgi:hypothetical protein